MALLLGCELVDDPEVTILHLILRQIFTWEWQASHIFLKNGLDKCLFNEMENYLNALLDQEMVDLVHLLFLDFRTHLASAIIRHFRTIRLDAQRRWMAQYDPLKENLVKSLEGMFSDVSRWLTNTRSVVSQELDRNGRELKSRVTAPGIKSALHFAKSIHLEKVHFWKFWSSDRRLPVLCSTNALDEYFGQDKHECYKRLLQAAHALSARYQDPADAEVQRALNLLLTHFPDFPVDDKPDVLAGYSILPDHDNVKKLANVIKSLERLFSNIEIEPARVFASVYADGRGALDASNQFNLLVGDHQHRLDFLLPEFTVDLGVHIDRASPDRYGIVTIENLSHGNVKFAFTVNAENTGNLAAHLKSNFACEKGKLEIDFHFNDRTPPKLPMTYLSYLMAIIIMVTSS
jgi:hypothetical protein